MVYGYLMDFEDLAAWSNQTYGLRVTGKKMTSNIQQNMQIKQNMQTNQPIMMLTTMLLSWVTIYRVNQQLLGTFRLVMKFLVVMMEKLHSKHH